MWDEIRERLVDSFLGDPHVAAALSGAEAAVRTGRLSPTTAARRLLEAHGEAVDGTARE
jgi:LAO/AO transport system kinase